MKRHRWGAGQERELLVINGGCHAPGGWYITTENHPSRPRLGEKRPWKRRYYPPGYGLRKDCWALLRVLPNRNEWWVEPLNVEAERLGPYPNRLTAWAVWRLL